MNVELERVGVIDVGSNSVRIVVFDGAARSPAYFYDEKVMCGLGRGVQQSGVLNPEGKSRAFAALHRFRALADRMGLEQIRAVATAAVREASDGPSFCKQVVSELNIPLTVISGEQEAHLSAKGVLLGWPNATGLVCDIGGASMELAELEEGRVQQAVTSPLGPIALQDRSLDAEQLERFIGKTLAQVSSPLGQKHETLFLVGGSWRAIARLHMARVGYPLSVIQDYRVLPDALLETLTYLKEERPDARALSNLNIASNRASLLPDAAVVLGAVLRRFDISEVAFSSYGLREGLLFDYMPVNLRRKDPLIEACLAQEKANARFPGFGNVLFDWIKPLFTHCDENRLRVIMAACLLHDVTWRAHPDYRAAVCFEGATRANLGALGHKGRIYLAWALLHRYKSRETPEQLVHLAPLLSDADRSEAAAVGRAMRLGAMMSGADVYHMGSLSLESGKILLTIPKESAEIHGEVVHKRLLALANSLGCEAEIAFG